MGKRVEQWFDPDMLDLVDDEYDLEGVYLDDVLRGEEPYYAYVPDKVCDLRPLTSAAVQAAHEASQALQKASDAVGASFARDALAPLLLRQESLASARIENHRTTLASALEYEMERRAGICAMSYGADQAVLDTLDANEQAVQNPADSLSVDGICDLDDRVTKSDLYRNDECGILRDTPSYMGDSLADASFVATPAEELPDLMDDLAGWTARNVQGDKTCALSPVALAALVHLQLVTIHPFVDGNGRTARACSQAILRASGACPHVVAPISPLLLKQKSTYFDLLERFRNDRGPADPNEFVAFFAEICKQAAADIAAVNEELTRLQGEWRATALGLGDLAPVVVDVALRMPFSTKKLMANELGVPESQVGEALEKLVAAGLLQAHPSRVNSGVRVYAAEAVVAAASD